MKYLRESFAILYDNLIIHFNLNSRNQHSLLNLHMTCNQQSTLLYPNVFILISPFRNLPKNIERYISKFIQDKSSIIEYYLKYFMQTIRMLNVKTKKMVWKNFPLGFVARAATLFYNLPTNYVHYLNQANFIIMFTDDDMLGSQYL